MVENISASRGLEPGTSRSIGQPLKGDQEDETCLCTSDKICKLLIFAHP